MTKRKFMILDLAIFSAISILLELSLVFAFKKFPLEGYSVSFLILMGTIAVFRWNGLGVIPAILTGIGQILMKVISLDVITFNNILAALIGPIGLLLGLVWFKFYKKENMQGKPEIMWAYYLSLFLAVEAVRSLCYIGSKDIFNVLYTYFVLDLLNMLIGLVILIIAVKQKGFVVDMNRYLIEMSNTNPTAEATKKRTDIEVMKEIADADEVTDIALLDGRTLDNQELDDLAILYRQKTEGKSEYEIEEEQRNLALEKNKHNNNGGTKDDNS